MIQISLEPSSTRQRIRWAESPPPPPLVCLEGCCCCSFSRKKTSHRPLGLPELDPKPWTRYTSPVPWQQEQRRGRVGREHCGCQALAWTLCNAPEKLSRIGQVGSWGRHGRMVKMTRSIDYTPFRFSRSTRRSRAILCLSSFLLKSNESVEKITHQTHWCFPYVQYTVYLHYKFNVGTRWTGCNRFFFGCLF